MLPAFVSASDPAISRLFCFLVPFPGSWDPLDLRKPSEVWEGSGEGVLGTKARCCWATAGWSNGDGIGVQPPSEFPSVGSTLQTKMHCSGGVGLQAKVPSQPLGLCQEKLGLAAMWKAFGPDNRQGEPWPCR